MTVKELIKKLESKHLESIVSILEDNYVDDGDGHLDNMPELRPLSFEELNFSIVLSDLEQQMKVEIAGLKYDLELYKNAIAHQNQVITSLNDQLTVLKAKRRK